MAKQHNRDEREFLPAALEIQETPPSPIGRAISWSIILLFTIAVIWACIGKVDIVAVAHGKIIPSARTKVIQPLEIGTVRAIHVREGQAVTAGEVLIELDATSADADEERIARELLDARMDLARTTALIKTVESATGKQVIPEWPREADADAITTQQKLLNSRLHEHRAKLAGLDNQIQQRQAEQSETQEVLEKLQATLPLITERASSMKHLADGGMAARDKYLEVEQSRIEAQQDLAAAQEKLKGIQSAIRQARYQRKATEAELMNSALDRANEAEGRAEGLEQELIKAQQRSYLQQLTAPVSGVVQQLAVHTVGGVVTPAQTLMVVVPKEHNIEVEAEIANKDIGFIFAGQSAEVKVEAFPFTKYGLIDAELRNVSMDAVADEKQGLIYLARVMLKKSAIQVGERLVDLSPGMAVTVEVKTGERRLIEYIFSPLMQYISESVRER